MNLTCTNKVVARLDMYGVHKEMLLLQTHYSRYKVNMHVEN